VRDAFPFPRRGRSGTPRSDIAIEKIFVHADTAAGSSRPSTRKKTIRELLLFVLPQSVVGGAAGEAACLATKLQAVVVRLFLQSGKEFIVFFSWHAALTVRIDYYDG
jgi:hypothetical protein